MGKCPACGGEIREDMRFCPMCGELLDLEPEESPKDYWAEKLRENEDWLEDVTDEELPDINEEIHALNQVGPPSHKKAWIFAAIFLALAACGIFFILSSLKKPEDPIVRTKIYYGGNAEDQNLINGNPEDWVELKSDGSLRMNLLGRVIQGSWRLDGEKILCSTAHRDIWGTLKEGILSFDYSGIHFRFTLPENMDQLAPQETIPPVTAAKKEESFETWEGDYYGSLILTGCQGSWEENEGAFYDVCGEITQDEGLGTLALWNSMNKAGDRFCMADVVFAPGTTEKGKMYPEWGRFYDMELRPGEWVVDPGKTPFTQFPELLYFFGEYRSPEDPDSGFTYEVFLRPWGRDWEDIEEYFEEPFFLPPGYESWYLPLKEAGRTMPDHF